jgi:hypothetical protein
MTTDRVYGVPRAVKTIIYQLLSLLIYEKSRTRRLEMSMLAKVHDHQELIFTYT